MSLPENLKDYFQEHRTRFIDELVNFLKIPSISSLPEHKKDVSRAGEWTANRLTAAGLQNVEVMPTDGHPVVYADWLYAPGKPTVMIYGHFDVQPVDPIEKWTHGPFDPTIQNDRIYARGAADDKGNLLIPISVIEAMLKTEGQLPVNVKCLFEGQEEIGSPQLPKFIADHADLLKCDLIISADGGQWGEDQPAVLLGLRGLCAMQIDVQGAAGDVHSGLYGGAFLNPIHALAEIIHSMHDSDGKVAVQGFYEGVEAPGKWEREQMAKVPYDESDFLQEIGVPETYGEAGYSTYERMWVRPTLELNGIWGGFQGQGTKTVIPSLAHAKISCRLVPGQDPKKIAGLLEAHVQKNSPKGVKVKVRVSESGADAYVIPPDHAGNQAIFKVHKELYGKDPYYTRMGGSIPICGILLKTLGAHTVNFAFGLKDENVHAPDEFFRLSSFDRGQKGYGMLLAELGRWKPEQ